MLKIRLMRIGAKKRPFYRIVVVDERAKRTGGYIENIGTYNPLTEPKEIKLNQERVDHWIKQGAQKSDGFLRIIGEAPQRPPRKPKKEKKESSATEPAKTAESTPAEETPAEEPVIEAAVEQTTNEPESNSSEPSIPSEKPAEDKEQSAT